MINFWSGLRLVTDCAVISHNDLIIINVDLLGCPNLFPYVCGEGVLLIWDKLGL